MSTYRFENGKLYRLNATQDAYELVFICRHATTLYHAITEYEEASE